MAQSVAEQIVEFLNNAGIERIYSVTGDSLNHLNDAVRRDGRIQWIHVRHEETGAFAAGAEAQLTGKLACCAGSSGPGHVHLVNGLYDAHKSEAPVLAIASTIHSGEFGSNSFQETNPSSLFDGCSHFNYTATTAQQAPKMLQMAMQHAVAMKGVGVLGLPGDVTELDAEEFETSDRIFMPKTIVLPTEEQIEELASLLNDCENVTIFCGIGASDAHDEVVELAKLLKAPVGYSFKAKMSIQHDNPNEVGMTGLLGLPSAFYAMHEADLLLLLGTDFPYLPFIPDDIDIVQIDSAPEKLGRRAKLRLGLHGSIKHSLAALNGLVKQKQNDAFLRSNLKLYADVNKKLMTYVNDQGAKDKIHPEFVAHTLNDLTADDAIYTVDTGMSCVWAARYLHSTGKRRLLGSFNHGSMANALPQAIGASLAFPGRQVLALCGDGGLSMTTGDLATVVQYKLPIKIIIFNNRSLGMVKLEMQVQGLPDWQTDMLNPDFELLAKAYGMEAATVREPSEVASAVKKCLADKGPVLLNILTDPNALAMPPKINFGQVKGMTKSMSKLMLNGQFDEVWETIKSNFKHAKELI